MKRKTERIKKAVKWFYFTTRDGACAYRATGKVALGEFHPRRRPELWGIDRWIASHRYADVEEFIAALQCGTVVRVSMLAACVAVNGDVRLFAPTLSSRIASKKA